MHTSTMRTASAVLATLVGTVTAEHPGSFAVLRFHGQGPLTEGCVDPIVSPGGRSGHAHTIMGASNFDTTISGESLLKSECTNANVPGDNSVYWMPKLYFQDPKTKKFEDVNLYYANVYYFFDQTDDDIVPFPPGLKIVSGDAMTRVAPAAGGNVVLDPEDAPDGKAQPAQWTCPRSSDTGGPTYPENSDGSRYGIKNSSPSAYDFGTGFPVVKCDGLYSPLRADLHFPSCYNPEAGLDDWQNNMAWPSRKYQKNGNGRKNCPPGYLHVPHLFFEYYWDTQAFNDRWEVDGVNQPFVLANGDRTGFSLHGDFASGWNVNTLEWVIGNCDAGTIGMHTCFPDLDIHSMASCTIESPVKDTLTGAMDALPCGNPLVGWGVGDTASVSSGSDSYEPADVESSITEPESPEPTVYGNSNAGVPEPETPEYETTESGASGFKAAEYGTPEPETPEPEAPEPETPKPTPAQDEEEPQTTAAAETSVPEDDEGDVYTHWVTETVYMSTTVYVNAPQATAVEKRHVHKRSGVHGHGHMHKRFGFSGRR